MTVIEEGHIYRLEGIGKGQQIRIVFCKKEKVAGSDELVMVHDGTTTEEVIEVLLDRLDSLNQKLPCQENVDAINCLREVLMHLEMRTERRVVQSVEGTGNPHKDEET